MKDYGIGMMTLGFYRRKKLLKKLSNDYGEEFKFNVYNCFGTES